MNGEDRSDSLRATLLRIGGSSALAWQVIAAAMLLDLFLTIANGQVRLGGDPLRNLTSGLFAMEITLAALLVVRDRLLPVVERPSRPLIACISYFSAGALFGFLRALTAAGFRIPETSYAERLIFPGMFSFMVMSAVSDLLASRMQQRAWTEQLLQDHARLTGLRANYAEQCSRFRTDLGREVGAAIDPVIDSIHERLDAMDASVAVEVRGASELLVQAARDVVRPLSHSLAEPDTRDLDLGQAGARIVGTALVAPRLVNVPASLHPPHAALAGTVLAVLGGAALPVTGVGWTSDFALFYAVSVASAALVWPITALARHIWPSRWTVLPTPAAVVVMFIVFWAALAPVRMIMIRLFSPALYQVVILPSPAVAALPGAVLSVLLTVEAVTRQHRADVRAEISAVNDELDLAVARLRKELWHNRSTTSRLLHGPLQSALLSTAAVLATATLDASQVQARRQVIEEAVSELRSGRLQSLRMELAVAELVRVWGFSCAIDVDLPHDLATRLDDDEATTRTVAEIMREGVSNAIRHGGASHVAMSLHEPRGGILSLRMQDNGSGLSPGHANGLGSAMLDQTSYRWSRVNNGDGTLLTVDLAW